MTLSLPSIVSVTLGQIQWLKFTALPSFQRGVLLEVRFCHDSLHKVSVTFLQGLLVNCYICSEFFNIELEAFEGVPAKTRVPRLDLNMLIKFHAPTQRANKQCIQIFSSFPIAKQCFVLHNEYLKFCDLESSKVVVHLLHLGKTT